MAKHKSLNNFAIPHYNYNVIYAIKHVNVSDIIIKKKKLNSSLSPPI